MKNALFTNETTCMLCMYSVIHKQSCRHWNKDMPFPIAFSSSFPDKQNDLCCFINSFVIGPTNANPDSFLSVILVSHYGGAFSAKGFGVE